MGKHTNLKDIGAGLQSRENGESLALGYLQRLNLAGYDLKGQLSSAYGQSGVGLAVSANMDFGALLLPFVHLTVGGGLKAESTAHTVLLLHRLPHRVWLTDMVRPPQAPTKNLQAPLPPFPRPDWTSTTPLVLAMLKGRNLSAGASAAASAWVGFGSLDVDETGLAIGAQAQGGYSRMFVTRLVDIAPRHYPARPSDSALGNDLDDLFDADLKARAAAWLIETGRGVGELVKLGAPRIPLGRQVEWQLPYAKIEAAIMQGLSAWDAMAIPDLSASAIAEDGFSVLKAMSSAAKTIGNKIKNSRLVTNDLVQQLGKVQPELKSWVETLEKRRAVLSYGKVTQRRLLEIARLRLAESSTLIEALERRSLRKVAGISAPAPPAAAPGPQRFHLDIATSDWSGDASAVGKLVLPFKAGLSLSASGKLQRRTISLRYQSHAPGSADRSLISTQDTVITYVTRKLAAQGSAGSHGFLEERPNLVTMSYRSVLANWFADSLPNNHQAIPNGSGISFGMSVLSASFAAYARACKPQQGGVSSGSPPAVVLDQALTKLEDAMMGQLRVGRDELRTFMREAPSSMGKVKADPDDEARVESYLVESAFAFTAALALPMTKDHRPKLLFDLAPAKKLVAGNSDPALRLQVIRLRYRIRNNDDKSRNLIRLGWSPEPWGDEGFQTIPYTKDPEDGDDDPWYVRLTGIDPSLPDWMKMSALALQIGIGVERVRRVGSEGIVDLYYRMYPRPYSTEKYGGTRASELEARMLGELPDMLVPGVALFNY